MNPAHNRFAPRRLLIIFGIGVVVMLTLGVTEAGIRETFGTPNLGAYIGGGGGGIIMWALLFLWRGGYPPQE
jgi:hypothetical protein